MKPSKRIEELKEKVALLPQSPGVYQFLGSDGQVIYVGKAKNLHRRVYSYFTSKANESPKVRVMVSRIADLRHTVVSSESEAFLLENNMIKSLQPRYNILLKDDKTYPWSRSRACSRPGGSCATDRSISGLTRRSTSKRPFWTWHTVSTACAPAR